MATSTNTQLPNRARTLMRVLLALLLGGALVFGPATTAHAADGVKMPNTVGMSAKTVRNLLRDEGFVVKLKPKSHGPVVMPSHWKVTKQSPKAGTVIEPGDKIKLTVKLKKKHSSNSKSPVATKTVKADLDETSAGLDGAHAATACDRYGDAKYPYGWKGHIFLGVIASEAQGDHYFFKFEADITNAFDAEASATVDCTITGTNDAPEVTEFDVY